MPSATRSPTPGDAREDPRLPFGPTHPPRNLNEFRRHDNLGHNGGPRIPADAAPLACARWGLGGRQDHFDEEVIAMKLGSLDLNGGTWLAVNCGKFPSEKNCRLVIMAPADQRDDLVEAASAHAIKVHGHADTPQLRQELGAILETLQL